MIYNVKYNVFTHLLPRLHCTGLHGHDIKLDSLKTSAAFEFMIILENLMGTNHRQSGKNKYDRTLPELDIVTMRSATV